MVYNNVRLNQAIARLKIFKGCCCFKINEHLIKNIFNFTVEKIFTKYHREKKRNEEFKL